MTIPGLNELLKDIKTLEDHAKARHSKEEMRMVPLTREEADVIESFRRFKAEGYDVTRRLIARTVLSTVRPHRSLWFVIP